MKAYASLNVLIVAVIWVIVAIEMAIVITDN